MKISVYIEKMDVCQLYLKHIFVSGGLPYREKPKVLETELE